MPPPPRRRPPRASRASRDAEKYLLPGEEPVVNQRRHWAVLLRPGARALPVLLAGGWLLQLDPQNRVGTVLGLLLVLGALGYLGLHTAEWWVRHFLVTRRRVLLTSGVLIRTVAIMPLRRITDLTWRETLFGQLLGYGTFRFESAGQDQALSEITYLPDAQRLYKDISQLLFGGDRSAGSRSEEDEESGQGGAVPAPRRGGQRSQRPGPPSGTRSTGPIPGFVSRWPREH